MYVRVCNYRECDNVIPETKNAKARYCCLKHKNLENTLRRQEADPEFYSQERAFANNYKILTLYDDNAILTYLELGNLGFDFDAMFDPTYENSARVFKFGKYILKDFNDEPEFKLFIRKQK